MDPKTLEGCQKYVFFPGKVVFLSKKYEAEMIKQQFLY